MQSRVAGDVIKKDIEVRACSPGWRGRDKEGYRGEG